MIISLSCKSIKSLIMHNTLQVLYKKRKKYLYLNKIITQMLENNLTF